MHLIDGEAYSTDNTISSGMKLLVKMSVFSKIIYKEVTCWSKWHLTSQNAQKRDSTIILRSRNKHIRLEKYEPSNSLNEFPMVTLYITIYVYNINVYLYSFQFLIDRIEFLHQVTIIIDIIWT